MEEWRPVPGYEGLYEVSSLGSVRSLPRIVRRGEQEVNTPGKVLKQATMKQGHASLNLCRDGVPKGVLVHRLVALAFLGDPPPGKDLVLHGPNGVSDNSVANLRWGNHKENTGDAIRDGTADFWGHSNRTKTHCPKEHPYSGDNLYIDPRGRRVCRTCKREWARRKREDRKVE